jgi:hypothetical protein
MNILDVINKLWPICLGAITLVIVLSKLDLRVSVMEEKIRTIFSILNDKDNKK